MLHALPPPPHRVRPVEKNHPKPRRQYVAARRRDYTRPERRPFFEKGHCRNTYPQCDPPGRRTADPQRLGRRAALLGLHLPEVPPLPQSTPALSPPVTHRFPRRAKAARSLRFFSAPPTSGSPSSSETLPRFAGRHPQRKRNSRCLKESCKWRRTSLAEARTTNLPCQRRSD